MMNTLNMSPSPKARATRRDIGNRIRALLATWPIRGLDIGFMTYKPPVIRVTSARASNVEATVAAEGSEIFFRGQIHGGKLPTKADVFEGLVLYLRNHTGPIESLMLPVRAIRNAPPMELDYRMMASSMHNHDRAKAFLDGDVETKAVIEKAMTMSGRGMFLHDFHQVTTISGARGNAEAASMEIHQFLQRLAVLLLPDAYDQV